MGNWETVILDPALKGEKFTSGSGYYEKEYVYIHIPVSAQYDHYCFAISSKLVDDMSQPESLYLNLCMEAEYVLQKDPEHREEGKRYKRYKMTGKELYETVLEAYEDDFLQKRQQVKEEKELARARREKKVMGYIVYGQYKGNNYGEPADLAEDYFFENQDTHTYFNRHHKKISNVVITYKIDKLVSKHYFRENMSSLHEKLQKWKYLKRAMEVQDGLLSMLEEKDPLRDEIVRLQQKLRQEAETELDRQMNSFI